MRTSAEIMALLKQVHKGEVRRGDLARWLAANSLRFLESANDADKRVIADLDVALGEVQRDIEPETFLAETAGELLGILERETLADRRAG